MKRSIAYLLVLNMTLGTSCKKYLEQAPDMRTTLNTPEKVSELLVTAYPGGNYFVMAEAMSDNPIDCGIVGGVVSEVNGYPYFWKDVISTSQDSPTYYWNKCYEAISAANHALDVCEHAEDPSKYSAQKGEALVARAYAHFMLVTLYAKPYDPNTAAKDIGIPYVTDKETVVFKQYDRKTVAYVYEQIEKDLQEGIPLINDNYAVPAYHFTRKAAHAFATRFYLFKKDYDKVIEEANLAFPSNNFAANVRPWLSYQNYASAELENAFTNANNPGNLLLCETVSRVGSYYGRYQYSLSSPKKDLIISPLGQKFSAYKSYSYSSTYYFVKKFMPYFVRTSINASTGVYHTMVPLLTTEEVLLNRAEAYIWKGMYDKGLKDMNTLISTRMTSYTPSSHDFTESRIMAYYTSKTSDKQTAYIYALLDLKRAEFIHEGMRWLDILRYKMPVTHTTQDGQVFELAADDNRKQLQLPEEVTLSGLPLNPR
ncbi:RagB/SusD family nutrient uptake outer membrane protein [Chitinophaga caeni]|uniref:RagB/SusD family nutrient uptake outer membrane protein n=1 Tax=Chitinophaga caeni TaxID=2029983 RepID=A0A291QUV7_9BACT|nr:RagB/SusD family nutrient uptake outer membrane protein [Chitinophaga caeni]ATL47653.1 RagB/SusD family nutrient uptake outer membrane protein [Chitinophaga caeni]